jgi:hypothetical protein
LLSLFRKSRLSVVKNLLGSNPHLEVCRNLSASVIYCKKEGDFYEFGQLRGPGKRNDLDEFKKAVKAGMLSIILAILGFVSNTCSNIGLRL